MKGMFADAFFYVACLNRADQHHEKGGKIKGGSGETGQE